MCAVEKIVRRSIRGYARIHYHTPDILYSTYLKAIVPDHRTNLSPRKEGAVFPAGMFRAFSSLLPSTPPADVGAHTPVVQGEVSQLPRKVFQSRTPENEEESASDLDSDSGSMNASRTSVQTGSSGPGLPAMGQEGHGVQGAERPEFPGDGEHVQALFSTPETINYDLQSEAGSEIVDQGVGQTDHTITYTTTTTTEVKEQKSADVQKTELSGTAREGAVQPQRGVSTFSSRTTSGQQRFQAQSPIQGGVQRKASFYQETHFPPATETGQSRILSSASKAVETRRFVVPSKSAYSSVREHFLQIERLHREEKDRIVALMTDEHDDYKRLCEEQFEALQDENARLLLENSASISRITLLEIQLSSLDNDHPGTVSQPDKVDSNITTITTNITTITTTITTVSTRIEQWKHTVARNKGQIIISSKELEQLSLDLSNTSSQMVELQRHYAELSRDFNSVRHELRVTLSLGDEKARTIAYLTAEVAQWKNADAAKEEQITASRRDNETLRRDLSIASSRSVELQQRHDAQSRELDSVRDQLQTKVALIEERDRTIASSTAEVARWKQSDAMKTEQVAIARRDYEKLQRDFSAATSSTADLQKRYDAQTKELSRVRNEFQANKSLVEERERTITTLTAEVDQWKRADATTKERFAAEHRDKEKLQRDLGTFSSQTADLQKRYDTQSKDVVSLRSELQTKVLLLEEREHTISSLTTEVAQVKREDNVKAEQITTLRSDVEQLRRKLSAASSRIADLQTRYEAQSKELDSVRDELHQIEILSSDKIDQATGKPSKSAVSQHIASALGKKKNQIDELRRDLAASTARNTELQRSYEALSSEVSTLRNELKVKTSGYEGTTTSLTAQVDQWKRADATKAERIVTITKQVEKLQQDLSTSTSQLASLQARYETQSREFITVRNELQTSTTSNEGKDRTIATLAAQVDQWKLADATKAEKIAISLKQVENLQRDSSASASKLAELQESYEAQAHELITVRNELRTSTSFHESKDHTIASLTEERDQWKRADATKAERIAITVKQVEKVQRDLSVSASQLLEIQGRYEVQSRELISVRTELQTSASSSGDKDRKVAALTAQLEEWKRKDSLTEERIVTIRKQAEDLQLELTSSNSKIVELQRRYDLQMNEVSSLRIQLQGSVSDKDHIVASLISQVDEWKLSDATKAKELTTSRKDVEQLRRDLTTSSSQILEFQKRYEARSAELMSEVEGWKRSDTTKTDELTTVRKDLEQLRLDLSSSSTQIVQCQQRYAAQSAELTSEIEQWKRSDAAKAEELATVRKKLEQLQLDLSASSSRIVVFEQRYEVQSTELSVLREQLRAASLDAERVPALNDQIEQWKRADAEKVEELSCARRDLQQLQLKLSASSSEIEQLRKHYDEQVAAVEKNSTFVSEESKKVYQRMTTEVRDYAAVIKLTTTVDEWLRADAKRAEDLALELERRNKENEELRRHLVTLKDIYIRAPELKLIFQSETVEVQQRYEQQSRELRSALAERQSQLDGVKRFVTMADTYADAMIIQMLQKLNAEVQQSTTFISECLAEDFRANSTKEQASIAKKVAGYIGEALVGCLGRNEHEDVALYLQIALQAYLTNYLRWLISSWTVEKGYNDLINKTYKQLQQSEAQTISGRWRSLTRAYISPTCMSDPNTLTSNTVAGLADIVVAAGCATSVSAAKSKVASKFGDKVASIISIAGQLSKMIGEVVSADFEVLAVRPTEVFEEMTMEEDVDDFDQGVPDVGAAAGQKVVCSTQLGMTKRMQLESGEKDTLTVMKAKVILESFLGDQD